MELSTYRKADSIQRRLQETHFLLGIELRELSAAYPRSVEKIEEKIARLREEIEDLTEEFRKL